jgi:hypothetical protein
MSDFIKEMYTQSRSIGCSWIISDQFATELPNYTRAASCLISFQHPVPSEIREISVAMGCNEAQKRMIPQMGRYRALQKIAEHPYPYQIMTHKSEVQRHIDDAELERLMRDKITMLNSQLVNKLERKKPRLITIRSITEGNTRVKETAKIIPSERRNPLEDVEGFLRFINGNPGTKLTDIYKALRLSGRKGDALKNKAMDNGLIEEKIQQTGRRGRPIKELKLTEGGVEYINEK